MKLPLICTLFLFTSLQLWAQTPQTIRSYASHPQELSWYKQQSQLWKHRIDQEPQNAHAWKQYFAANRVLMFHDSTDKRSKEQIYQSLENILNDMEKAIPNSYEFNFCKWQLGGNNLDLLPYLEKAIAIDSTRTDHIDYMINISEMKRNVQQRNLYAKKLMDKQLLSTGLIYYNYNVISGLKPKAILLTAGDNDTYPAWALQAKGIRNDVWVINNYLLHIESYRSKIFSELGLPEKVFKDKTDEETFFNKELLSYLLKNKKNYPVYLSLTAAACQPSLEQWSDNLYLTGLSYEYSQQNFDNISTLRKNMEHTMALDYIDKAFYIESAEEKIKEINRNYLVPMMKLYQHYQGAGDKNRLDWLKEKMQLISQGTEDESYIQQFLAE
ncbi:MAG TPA: hypothetical protein PLU10_06295 [Chitinophagaceae bacterium]|nr:hypothetical protein [Chitinophagaceae bacterium]